MKLSTAAATLLNLCGTTLAIVAAGTFTAAQEAAAQAETTSSTVGTIVIAHGADEVWNAPVLDLVEKASAPGPVEVAFLMGDAVAEHRFQDAVQRLVDRGAERIVVVPLLASSFSEHYDQIRYLAGELDHLDDMMMHHLHHAGIHRSPLSVPISLTPAIDASPEIATILAERALNLTSSPGEEALFIMGHGPGSAEDYAEWMRNLRPVADSVRTLTGFRDVKLDLVRDDAPAPVRAEAVLRIREIIELQRALTGRPVVVVPMLVSKGFISTVRFPADLAGLDITYDGEGLLPHSELVRWAERRIREAVDEGHAGGGDR